MKRRVAVLGSTGSIGIQALEVIDASDRLELHSILCGSRVDILSEQAAKYRPASAHAVSPPDASSLVGIMTGHDVLEQAVHGADMVLNAIVGSAGLEASLLCQEMDIPLALANKESLVIGGELLEEHLSTGSIIPVDSEHSTIHRCIAGEETQVLEVMLTASGGSVRGMDPAQARTAGPSEILAHPTWDMGRRITVDSASMVNKAFEVIEASWLFGVPVDTVLHPQSVVHSFVRLADGAWKALLGSPDMKIPIQYALLHGLGELTILEDDRPADWGRLDFSPVDDDLYPAFSIVCAAGDEGGTLPAVVNAADEVAVEAFLTGRIRFGDIPQVLSKTLERHDRRQVRTYGDVAGADSEARATASMIVEELCC